MRKKILILILLLIGGVSCGGKSTTTEEESKAYENQKALSVASLRRGNFQQAMKEIEEAEAMNNQDPEVYMIKGLIYFGLKDYPVAANSYLKAISLNPKYSEARYNLCGLYLRTQEYDKAIEQCSVASSDSLYRARPRALTSLGVAYFNKGNINKAKEYYEQALSLNPAFVYAHNELGKLYLSTGRDAEAIAEFKNAIAGYPAYDEAHYNLGLAYLKQGENLKACESFRTVVKLSPVSELGVNANKYLSSICM